MSNIMKFYDFISAPNPRRIRIMLAEKNIEVEIIQVDLRTGEQFSEDYRRINPNCTVPVLQLEEGSCITESIAIADYLENRFPENPMFGTNPQQRAAVLTWNAISEQRGIASIADIFRNSELAFKDRAIPGTVNIPQMDSLIERGHLVLEGYFNSLDKRLGENEYLVGDVFSYADITAFIVLEFMLVARLEQPTDYENIKRWYEQIKQRPSIEKSLL